MAEIGSYKPSGFISMEFAKGEPFDAYEKGNVYCVLCMATWCPPCKRGCQKCIDLLAKFPKVQFIVCTDESVPTMEQYPLFEKLEGMRVLCGSDEALKMFWVPFEAKKIPWAFLMDQTATVVWHGSPFEEEFEEKMEELQKT